MRCSTKDNEKNTILAIPSNFLEPRVLGDNEPLFPSFLAAYKVSSTLCRIIRQIFVSMRSEKLLTSTQWASTRNEESFIIVILDLLSSVLLATCSPFCPYLLPSLLHFSLPCSSVVVWMRIAPQAHIFEYLVFSFGRLVWEGLEKRASLEKVCQSDMA